MIEYILIVFMFADPGGGPTTERVATEAECETIGQMMTGRFDAWGGGGYYECFPVAPLPSSK